MPTLAEQWYEEGKQKGEQKGLIAVRQIILEQVEEYFGSIAPNLPGKLFQIQDYDVLCSLRRQLKKCANQAEFIQLVEQAL